MGNTGDPWALYCIMSEWAGLGPYTRPRQWGEGGINQAGSGVGWVGGCEGCGGDGYIIKIDTAAICGHLSGSSLFQVALKRLQIVFVLKKLLQNQLCKRVS